MIITTHMPRAHVYELNSEDEIEKKKKKKAVGGVYNKMSKSIGVYTKEKEEKKRQANKLNQAATGTATKPGAGTAVGFQNRGAGFGLGTTNT
jgi:hypothetical protein